MRRYGANPGRSGYKMAVKTAEQIYFSREAVRSFFNAKSAENIVFTHNCTTALNICIKSLAKKGGNFVCSSLEHNAVMRPLEKLKQLEICDYKIAGVNVEDDEKTVTNFDRLIDENTRGVIVTASSNVFGFILPLKRIAELCKKRSVPLVVDAAQLAGIMELDCRKLGIDFLCVAAHKGLYAPLGTGILIVNSDRIPDTLVEGGTGSNSLSLFNPDFLPDRLESGTLPTADIISLRESVGFIRKTGLGEIYSHEYSLMYKLDCALKEMKNVTTYSSFADRRLLAPVLSFNIRGKNSEEVANELAKKNICVRAGYHCAFMAHKSLDTLESGTVRISPSFFTKNSDINFTINSIYKLQNI